MTSDECGQCGERNVAGAMFCGSCRAYLGWDLTPSVSIPPDGAAAPSTAGDWSTPTLVVTAPRQPEAATGSSSDPIGGSAPEDVGLRALLDTTEAEIAPGGESAGVELDVHNKSEIVDAYVVDLPDAPTWLESSANRVRLMPGTSGKIRLSLWIREGISPVAQRLEVSVRVRSEVDAQRAFRLPLAVLLKQVSHPIALRVEPSVIRVKDETTGEFVLFADNTASNRAVHLRLSAQDPEQVTVVHFAAPAIEVPAGEVATVRARLEAPLPDPGCETTRQLTISAFDGARTTQALVSFAQRASPSVVDPPVALRLHPSIVSVIDAAVGECRLEIDNSNGRHGAHLLLRGEDPEGSIRFELSESSLDLAPASTATIAVRLAAPEPESGAETARPFTITARYGDRSVDGSGTFRQRASVAAIKAVRLRLEPSHVRVRNDARGRVRVIADNRSGTRPARIWLRGTDEEGTTEISFSAPYVDLPAGQQAFVDAQIRAPRPRGETEHTRKFTITAADGRDEIGAEGTFSQTATDRRPTWRSLTTLLGGLAMMLGAFLPWTAGPVPHSGVQWTIPEIARLYDSAGPQLNATVARIACAGAVVIVLALLAIWGRLGPKGRLTRLSALLALCLTIGFLIFLHVRHGGSGPSVGAIVVVLGCLSAYAGGQLAKR